MPAPSPESASALGKAALSKASLPQVPSSAGQLAGQAAADTTQAAAPDSSAFSALNEGFNEGMRLLFTRQWAELWDWVEQGAVLLLSETVRVLLSVGLFLIFAYLLYRLLQQALDRFLEHNRRVDAGLQNLLMKTFRVGALLLIGVMVLDRLEFNVTALFAGLGIVGIAIGFAARDSLENFISGVTILIDRPFRVGDNIKIDDQFGTVEDITLRSTRVRTLNNKIMVMPNIQMINQKLLNHTMLRTLRVQIDFGIAYKEYPQEAREVILDLVEGDDRLHDEYSPTVVVTEMGDSSVNMQLRLYVKNPKQEVPVRLDYTEKVREALREADIEIPFPHLQLFVDEAKAFEGAPWMPRQRSAPDNGSPAAE